MAKDPKKVAKLLLAELGGEENITTMTHCATRLRVVVKDDEKIDKEKIETIEGVSGYFCQSGQHQIILGTGFVNKVYSELKNDGVETEGVKEESREKMSRGQQLTRNFADIFVPIIPVLVATGLLMGLRGLLMNGFGVDFSGSLLTFSQVLTDTAFVFIPVLVTWSATKKFGGNPVIGIVLGLMLVAPQLPDKWAVSFGNAEALKLSILGLKLQVTAMQSSILPAVFMGWLSATLERNIRKIVPDVVDLVFTPFLTLLTSMVLGLIFVGPVLLGIENVVTDVIVYFLKMPYGIGGLLYGGLIQFLAVTGMHHTIVPITVKMVAETGYDITNPLGTAAIAGQAGAALAIALAQKNKVKKSNMISAIIPAFFGITEPVMFAINLPKGKPFLFGCLGGAVGGALAAILNIAAAGTGSTMLPGMLLYMGGGLPQYILVMIVALGTAFIATKFAYNEDESSVLKKKKVNVGAEVN
jgi:PTS system sucrose-specific IIC component